MRKLKGNIIDMGNFTTLWPLYGAPATTNQQPIMTVRMSIRLNILAGQIRNIIRNQHSYTRAKPSNRIFKLGANFRVLLLILSCSWFAFSRGRNQLMYFPSSRYKRETNKRNSIHLQIVAEFQSNRKIPFRRFGVFINVKFRLCY